MIADQNLIAAVIPALNEEKTIEEVVLGLKHRATPIVVDDGSHDKTSVLAREAGAVVIGHSENKGYDAALSTGLQHARDMGFIFAVTLDADGQHQPELIDLFVSSLNGGSDIVIGIRDRHQRLAEAIFAIFSIWLWGIKDPLCGMKGYRLSSFVNAGPFNRYSSIGTVYSIAAARSGFKIEQIALKTSPRTDNPRFGNGIRANFRILKALLIGLLCVRSIQK